MKNMDEYENSASSSSIGYLSADDTCSDSVSSNMLERDDASSSPPNGHMFQLSDLMSQLPIKRGLSRYYNGKSDSFKNLISVKSLEDVPKYRSLRSSLYRIKKKKKKNLNSKQHYYTTPKSKISKNQQKLQF